MGSFQVRYNSRVVIYERKMFIRLATDVINNFMSSLPRYAKIKHSDWLEIVMPLGIANQNTLFQ